VLLALSDQFDAMAHSREAELQSLRQELATLSARQDMMQQQYDARVQETVSAATQVRLHA
jgi:hypothetical protein